MTEQHVLHSEKIGNTLVKNLKNRHFDAYYCATKEQALEKALSLIPAGSTIGWGGAASAQEIGLLDAVRQGDYIPYDRDKYPAEKRMEILTQCTTADVFITGANALSVSGEMVNIDGIGNRVAAISFGPKSVIVIAGINKVCADLESAIKRARTVAAPINHQRFGGETPCMITGVCGDCKREDCICNQILISRHCRPVGRIKFIIVGQNLGF